MRNKLGIVIFSLFLFGCSENPSDSQIRTAGRMFRVDMQSLIDLGGKVKDYQDGRRNANYYFLTLYANSFNDELQKKYMAKLAEMGWKKLDHEDDTEIPFCKNGARAAIYIASRSVNGEKVSSIHMVYTAQTIKDCRQAFGQAG